MRGSYGRRQKVYYRLANQRDASSCWEWESRMIASVDILFRVLWMYRAVPRYHLRLFFSSSVAGLDLMLDRANRGLVSNSILVDQLFYGKWSTSQSMSPLEMRQIESELRTREGTRTLESAIIREQNVSEKRRSLLSEGSLDVLDSRRLELELGTPGDHDTLYMFSLPTYLPQTLAWLKLLTGRSSL